MLATAPRKRGKVLLGTPLPRLGPPRPLKSSYKELSDQAAALGVAFIPWQDTAARYIEGLSPSGWLYPDVFIGAGRQNGKTWLLRPHIVRRLRMGRRILHSAQDRRLPRDVYLAVAEDIIRNYPDELAAPPRFANGQEEIRLRNGGRYLIVAPTRSGARGISADDLIIDEVCEFTDLDFLSAASATTSASPNAQTLYLSNAGTPDSVVLESLRARAEAGDPSLAYLEWSADPEYSADDIRGWLQANPAVGHVPTKLANIERAHRAAVMGNTLSIFEREILCRTTVARRELLIAPEEWAAQSFTALPPVTRAVLGVKMDVSGERASAVAAWPLANGHVALELVLDEVDHPLDVDLLGPELVKRAAARRVTQVGFDAYTDADLIRLFRKDQLEPVRGNDYAKASEGFVRRTKARDFVVGDENGLIAEDLTRTIRKSAANGTYIGAKATNEPNTAAQAAIAAVWLATRNPYPYAVARIS